MSPSTNLLFQCCHHLHRLPSLFFCFFVIILQDCFINYYLIHHLGQIHWAWVAPDLIVLILVLVCFRLTRPSRLQHESNNDQSKTYTLAWVTWLLLQSILAAKILIAFLTFATELEEEGHFFGPNTFKMTIALGGCIYVLMLSSQHNVPPSDTRRRYIDELTGSVVMDILDTADILDVMFDAEMRQSLATGLPETILFVAVFNLLLPTVPLITLSITKFGQKRLSQRMVYLHHLLLVLGVNVPNLIVRMVMWHGFSVGISPFILKNIIQISKAAHEFFEHEREKFDKYKEEKKGYELQERDVQNRNGISEKQQDNDDDDECNATDRLTQ